MSNILHSKFGNCSLNPQGHYRVVSRVEGNHSKLLHRLIWEDKYESKLKMSKKRNSTGFFRIYMMKDPRMSQGYRWVYSLRKNHKSTHISSTDLMALKNKVLSKGYEWEIVDESLAKKTCKLYNLSYEELI